MRALVVIAWLACFGFAQAAEDVWPEGSAMGVGQLQVHRRDRALKTLSSLSAKVVRLMSESEGADERAVMALKAQQAAWRRYVVDECELVGSLTGAGGSWPSTYAVRCEANLAELRVRRTRAAARCLERTPADRRRVEASACLYQLAPLAVPLR